MQQRPEPGGVAEILGIDAVEQVVSRDHGKPDRGDYATRQVHESRQHHHRRAGDPDHLHDENVDVEAEGPAEAHQRELDQDEPEPARQQE
jgi:hypothetical protein